LSKGKAPIITSQTDAPTVAAIYARTSSPNQKYNYSIDEQVNECWDYCKERQWAVRYVFVDESQRAKTTERPKFQLMLERARAREFQVIVFWKLDRFCRSLRDLVNLEKEFGQCGVQLCSVTEFIDTSSPVGRFNYRNLASVAELESEIIGERSRLGLYGLAREHKWPNASPPLGYSKTKSGRLTVCSPEAELVRRIFRMYLAEKSLPQVAYRLNQKQIPTKKGRWNARAVRDVLTNRIYIGKYEVAGFKDDIPELRIITDEAFDRCKAIMERYRAGHADRPRMPSDRKATEIQRLHEWYLDFLNGCFSGPPSLTFPNRN
jgi:site-specific DNA recombinase